MGLEKLRSVFAEGVGRKHAPQYAGIRSSNNDPFPESYSPNFGGVYLQDNDALRFNSIHDNIGEVDFFNDNPKINKTTDLTNPILGFTKRFTGINDSKFTPEIVDETRASMVDNFSDKITFNTHQRPVDLGLPTRTLTFEQIQNELQSSTLLETQGWEKLYNKDHTVMINNPGYNHGLNVARSNLRLENPTNRRGNEPYIVSDIGSNTASTRSIPISRSLMDADRISQFLGSPEGIEFIAKQNALGQISRIVYRDGEQMKAGSQMDSRFKGAYNPLSTLIAAGGRLLGPQPNVLSDRDPISILGTGKYSDFISFNVHDSFNMESQDEKGFFGKGLSGIIGYAERSLGLPQTIKKKSSGGDIFTNTKISTEKDGKPEETTNVDRFRTGLQKLRDLSSDKWKKTIGATDDSTIEYSKNGMPMYFQDLRDNMYVFFRAYISSLTENVSPTWNNETYIGRSEPVYTYGSTERDMSFNLKLFAHTKEELTNIYKKLTRLTSMCYPQYQNDPHFKTGGKGGTSLGSFESDENEPQITKLRMKPPLVKFRLGELYGNQNDDMLGFLKTLTYTYPDEGVWETTTGERVPKYIDVSFNFQVIHKEVPSLSTTDFYGIGA